MAPPATILIVTNGHLCRNPRPFKEATALADAGYHVIVTGIDNHKPSVRLDDELCRAARFRRQPLDLLGASPKARRSRLLVKSSTWLTRKFQQFTGREAIGALGPAQLLLHQARAIPAALTIVHNEVPHWVGTRLRAEGRTVAADIEDWHSEDLLPEDRRHRPLNLLRKNEYALLHHAAYTSTTSHALADALQARYGGNKPHVISNSFPLQPTPSREQPGSPPAFFWFSQTLGPGRGLEHFLAAWSRTHEPSRLVLLGEPCAGYKARLLNFLPQDFRTRVDFLPLVPPDELPAVIARYDIGLALEQAFIPNRDLTITNKILQYLNAGLAIVASNTAGQREVLVNEPLAGIIVDTHETTAFAQALDQLLADHTALGVRQIAARRLAERKYCWEHEAPRLLELVAATLAKPLHTAK